MNTFKEVEGITLSSDTHQIFPQQPTSELSERTKQHIELLQAQLAHEITNYIGTLMQAMSTRMLEAIHKAELPTSADIEKLDEIVSRSMNLPKE